MKKFLLIIICCYASTRSSAQTGELPPIEIHEVSQLGTPGEYIITVADSFPAGRLTCLPNSCFSVLLVTLLSFDGRRISEDLVELKWKTENETNNAGFDVERSLGNTSHFEKIAFVAGQGNSTASHNYQLNDPNNYAGRSFYRLKQIDRDGKYKYSMTIWVKGYSNESSLSVYPNPARSTISFSIDLDGPMTGIVSITDPGGRTLIQQTISLAKGNNVSQLSIDGLAAGMYLLSLKIKDQPIRTEKFIKQ